MKYYFKPENRIIETEELLNKYGSFTNISQLGMYELTEQPEYTPVGFKPMDGKYYPVESYESMQAKCIAALVESGMSEEEATAKIA